MKAAAFTELSAVVVSNAMNQKRWKEVTGLKVAVVQRGRKKKKEKKKRRSVTISSLER